MDKSQRCIVIQCTPATLVRPSTVEMCEHKGIGHPDTLTDGACEAAACALAIQYRQAFGSVLHFNIDKGLLVAGQSVPRFGGGDVTEPVKLFICGRATDGGRHFDVREVIVAAVETYLRENFPSLYGHITVIPEVRPGSANLASIYRGSRQVPIANDTSFGAGFAPFSQLENKVLELAAVLRSRSFRERFPVAGDDFKIMGLRVRDVFRFTVALALVDRYVTNVQHYFEAKRAIVNELSQSLSPGHELALNMLDDPGACDESGLYLTITGTSAEMGDDGQCGRGNRVNGLITPGRIMSLEAVAGKNPVCHVG